MEVTPGCGKLILSNSMNSVHRSLLNKTKKKNKDEHIIMQKKNNNDNNGGKTKEKYKQQCYEE